MENSGQGFGAWRTEGIYTGEWGQEGNTNGQNIQQHEHDNKGKR